MRFKHTGFVGNGVTADFEGQLCWALEQDPRPTGIEIGDLDGLPLHQHQEGRVREIAGRLKEAGLAVHCLTSSFGDIDMPEDQATRETVVAAQMSILDRLSAYAQILETPLIQAFALRRSGEMPSMWGQVKSFFERALADLPDGLAIAVENHPATACATLSDVARLQEALDPRIKAILSPGNYARDASWIQRTRQARQLPSLAVTQDIRAHRGLIALVHLNNCALSGPGLKETLAVPIDQGLIGYATIIEALEATRPSVPLDIDTQWGFDQEGSAAPCSADWRSLQSILALPT